MIKTDFLNAAWVLIPATGIGARAGMPHPKQYLKINHKYILDYTIRIFKNFGFKNILVILNSEDNYFKSLMHSQANIHTCIGGDTRYLSVHSALKYLSEKNIDKNTWILVHDAVRPCLAEQDLAKLISQVLDYEYNLNIPGGILAKPISDTLKYVENNIILNTVCRKTLYQALTPQMFKLKFLEQAYNNIKNLSASEKDNITDEAYLIEKVGFKSLIIESEYPNPKLTYPEDINYIKYLLENT